VHNECARLNNPSREYVRADSVSIEEANGRNSMSEVKNTAKATHKSGGTSPLKRIGIYAAIALGIFLLGLVPMWLTARERANERDAAHRELRLSQIQNRLASPP
jgi:hypothetical protein